MAQGNLKANLSCKNSGLRSQVWRRGRCPSDKKTTKAHTVVALLYSEASSAHMETRKAPNDETPSHPHLSASVSVGPSNHKQIRSPHHSCQYHDHDTTIQRLSPLMLRAKVPKRASSTLCQPHAAKHRLVCCQCILLDMRHSLFTHLSSKGFGPIEREGSLKRMGKIPVQQEHRHSATLRPA